jgi:phosphonate transport system permease protein
VGIPTIGYEIKTAYEDGHYHEIWSYVYALLIVVVLFEAWGAKVRGLLTKGTPSRVGEEKGQSLSELWQGRGRSWFLRFSVATLTVGIAAGWMAEDRWGAGVGWEQREKNLDRFTDEMVPYPVREADGDWSVFGSWFSEKMSDGGAVALWRTFHVGTTAILLAGGLSLIGILFAARTLAASNPRGVRDGGSKIRGLLGMFLRGASMLARAMPEYILAFLLLRVFGPTYWVLIFALAIHNGGILLRLGAEVIDNTKSQASEVILAQGGNRSSAYLAAMMPAGFNRLVLFLFYRWESCIREATVLGMLGVASLGFLISDAKVAFFYDEMILWVGLGAALVFVGDLTSDFVRGKLRTVE